MPTLILAQSAIRGAAAAPGDDERLFWLVLLAASVPGILLCIAGARRPKPLVGLDRGGAFPSLLQLAAVLFFGFFPYALIISAYNTQVHPGRTGPVVHTESDDAFLTTIPPLVAFFLLLAGDTMLGGREGLKALGIGPEQIPRGVFLGFLGALIAVPLVMWVSVLTDIVYQHFQYAHPMEHELLPAMAAGPLWARIAIFFGASIAAPLFEEIVFRGHIQTLVRSAIIRVSPHQPTEARPLVGDNALDYQSPRAQVEKSWHSWLAILLASAAFASVHPAWMRPPIFVFSLCLGYAYERTGLLWTTITMHAMFNLTETILYFQQMR